MILSNIFFNPHPPPPPKKNTYAVTHNSKHRDLYSNMGMRIITHNFPYDEIEILSSGS